MISAAELRKLAQGSGDEYLFDFSIINAQVYQSLFMTLQHFGVRNIASLGFSCDRLAEETRRGAKLSTVVIDSIAKHRTHYVQNIVELLSHLLRKSVSLDTVILSNIDLKTEMLSRLCNSFPKCGQLKKVTFNHIMFGDEGLRVVLAGLASSNVTSVTIKNCGLSHASIDAIKTFISGSRSLREFIVSPREFPPGDLDEIDAALSKCSSPILEAQTYKRKTVEELRRENAELKAELARLRNSVCAVKYNDRVFVIGKDADKFVQFMGEVGDRISQLEQQKSAMESFP